MKTWCYGRLLFMGVMVMVFLVPTHSWSGMGEKGHRHGGHVGEHIGSGHTHDRWVSPPKKYAVLKGNLWRSSKSIINGKEIYRENCASCHGVEGVGDGPLSNSLQHPPANLSRHFHPNKKENDGYLFWRLTEGGLAEPFKSQDSAMPSFKDTLTPTQRWEVLAFIYNSMTNDGGKHDHPWQEKADMESHRHHDKVAPSDSQAY